MEKGSEIYQAAIYIRLSKEDGDKFESNSVTNQRTLIKDFLHHKHDISIVNERIDDGYSGVTFDRPAMQEMLQDIKSGKINCVVVKDLSRFGRNYIEAGRYIEQIFPFMGVRFIAILDHIDTATKDENSNNIIVPFKNLMNDSYSRDISLKARTQLEIRQKRGDYVGSFPVYGYLRSQERKNKLIIDTVTAETIKEIFALRIQGHNNHFIAKYLNDRGVLSPYEYKQLMDFKFSTSFKLKPVAKWSHSSVGRILKNEIYTGVLLQGKEKTMNYKSKKRVQLPKEDWIRVENTHEAIIAKQDFALVQKIMLQDTRTAPENEQIYIFSGMLRCGDCGCNLVRKLVKSNGNSYAYYVCSKNKKDKTSCSSHAIREDNLVNTLRYLVEKHISLLCEMKALFSYATELSLENFTLKKNLQLLSNKKQEFQQYEKLRTGIYEDYKEGLLSKEEFIQMKAFYEKICSEIEMSTELLEKEIAELKKQVVIPQDLVNTCVFQNENTQLSRVSVVILIDEIIVFDKKRIEIKFNFQNEFE